MSILTAIAKSIGADTLLPIVEGIVVEELHSKGHDFLVHATTIPKGTIDALTHKFGSDPAAVNPATVALEAALVAWIESFAPQVK